MIRPTTTILSILIGLLISQHLAGQNQSVLATGNWYKIGVIKEGLYRLDANTLNSLGLGTSFNPKNLSVYGNGQGMLPQPNNDSRPKDLIENAIQFFGDEDDLFEQGEYFIFYAPGPHILSHDQKDWHYQHNIYTDTAYYFITLGTSPGKRILLTESSIQSDQTIRSDEAVLVYSPQETNLLQYVNSGGSGREWYGDLLIPSTGLVKNYDFNTPHLIDSLKLKIDVIGFSEGRTAMDVFLNQSNIGALQINASTVSTYSQKGRPSQQEFDLVTSGDQQSISIDFIRVDGTIFGFINEILLIYHRELIYENQPLYFNNLSRSENNYQISIQSDQELSCWDISTLTAPIALRSQRGSGTTLLADSASSFKKYVAFRANNVANAPISFGKISNQNIRSFSPTDGLIITAPPFLTEATRLAQHHANHDQLDVAVLTTHQIYNEFSSGMQDVSAIRDAIRHYYEKNQSLRYVLLFGDCSYDYKDRISSNTNLVPIYESINSWDPVLSYASDDYYGFMDEEEGEWRETPSGDHTLEIGIGRLPVKSNAEARQMVNKIIRYSLSGGANGQWKNAMTYVVDDGNAGLSDTHTHMEDAEDFIDLLWQNHPQSNPNKLYIDAFPQEVDGNSESSPIVRAYLKESISEGTFMVNFIGHGSEQRWTEESVLDHAFIDELSNKDRLPVFVTATCEFGRYDDPTLITDKSESGAEKLLLKAEGGAIALVTTTRPVFAFTNYDVNRAFHFFLMRPLEEGPESGQLPRLGDIIRQTKNNSLRGAINRNFALLGDPMLRLDYPDFQIIIDSINNQSINRLTDTLKAMETVTLSGTVLDLVGERNNNFNGTLELRVFDTFSERLTLGQRDDPFPYKVRENLLFNGRATINQGRFNVRFIMPKNISYKLQNGSITLYAYDPILDQDASGGFNQFLVGGSATNSSEDLTPPEITLKINSEGFTNGDRVSRQDTLIASIYDESGINTSGLGLNRNITLDLNGSLHVINHLYQATLDDYQSGLIRYPLAQLEPGRYTARLKLYDIYNNQSEESVDFIVSDQPYIRLTTVNLYPNPVNNHFSIFLEHDRTNETLDITMDILSVEGQVVMKRKWVRTDFEGKTDEIDVEIDDRFLQNGIYICRLTAVSRLDGAIGVATKRLVIIN